MVIYHIYHGAIRKKTQNKIQEKSDYPLILKSIPCDLATQDDNEK